MPPTLGQQVCRWIESNCVYGEGDYYGQPVKLRPFQQLFLYWLYELNPDGSRKIRKALLGMPKSNGKTPLASWVGSVELAGPVVFAGWDRDGSPRGKLRQNPIIPVGAASYEQSDLVFNDMKICWRESPTLSPHAEVYDTEILLKGKPGKAFRVAAARGTNDGLRPTAYIADEVHEFADGQKEGAHLVLSNGCAKRKDSLQLNITTAGHDLESLLGRMYLKGKRCAAEEIEDPNFLFVWYEASDHWDLQDPEQLREAIREAHPAADDFVDVEQIVARYHEIPEFEFARYFLNRWTRAEDSWLPPGAWEGCKDASVEIPGGAEVYVGVDVALYHDHTAVAIVHPTEDGKFVVRASTWEPGESGIDVARVMQHIRDLADRYTVKEVSYDPRFFDYPASLLADEGIPMLEYPQSAERMVPVCGFAYEQILAGNVVHNGDATLEDHVLSAAQRPGERGWTLSKNKSKRKIDAAIAMVIALHRCVAPKEEEPNLEPFFAWA